MDDAAKNAPLFVEAFYDACTDLQRRTEFAVPDFAMINSVLAQHNAGYDRHYERVVRKTHVEATKNLSDSIC